MAEKKSDLIKIKPAEMEKIVLELSQKSMSPAKIGLILRDNHAIPKARLLGKKISQILKENKIEIKHEIESINNKIVSLNKHIANNKQDQPAKRALTKQLWAIERSKVAA